MNDGKTIEIKKIIDKLSAITIVDNMICTNDAENINKLLSQSMSKLPFTFGLSTKLYNIHYIECVHDRNYAHQMLFFCEVTVIARSIRKAWKMVKNRQSPLDVHLLKWKRIPRIETTHIIVDDLSFMKGTS